MKTIKIFFGIFILLLILSCATIAILSLWDIHVVEWKTILKLTLSAGIVGICLFLVWIIKSFFFKKGI